MAQKTAVEKLSFEMAMEELETIVDKLERGDVPLEESITHYERGEALKARCEALLANAKMRVEKVRLKSDGTPDPQTPVETVDDDIPF
ncbi:MAG: exodeoxyribonuclease VII small subunit [Pseudomonadota bacterium]